MHPCPCGVPSHIDSGFIKRLILATGTIVSMIQAETERDTGTLGLVCLEHAFGTQPPCCEKPKPRREAVCKQPKVSWSTAPVEVPVTTNGHSRVCHLVHSSLSNPQLYSPGGTAEEQKNHPADPSPSAESGEIMKRLVFDITTSWGGL